MGLTIELHQDGGSAVIRPKGWLGDRFGTFRSAIEGATFRPTDKANVAPLDKVPAILRRLREAEFLVSVDEELKASLEKYTAQQWVDLQGAKERIEVFDAELRKTGRHMFSYQKYGAQWLAIKHGALLADDMGTGKAGPVSEPVLTPEGWKIMGDLRPGDFVVGSDGKPTQVLGVFPQGRRRIYRVTMTDGTSTRCTLDHLWYVETPNDRHRGTGGRVMTLRQIRDEGVEYDNGNRKWFIPLLSNPAEFDGVMPLSDYPSGFLHPYVTGALLANAHFGNSIVHSGTEEQREALKKLLPNTEFVRVNEHDYRLPGLTQSVKRMGLHGLRSYEKRIPRPYLTATPEERLALIRGLFDNDGTVAKDGIVVEYNTTSPQLARDVLELVRSMGWVARMSTRVPTFTYKGERKRGRKDHRIRIVARECPFSVPSKASRWKPRTKYLAARAIAKIEAVGQEEAVCIRVEAEDSLYVTKDYIVTHNTLQAIAAIPAKSPILVVAPAVAKGVWQREVAKWRPHLRVSVLSGRGNFVWPEPGEMVVINYDILPEVHTEACKKRKGKDTDGEDCKGCASFLEMCPENVTIIADEAHALKNGKAARTQKFRALGRTARARSGRTWLLTATPLLNRPQELWSVYQAGGIAQEAFGTWKGFLNLFQGRPAQFGGYTWGTPSPEVVERMQRVCLRRRREEVMPELPRKTWRSLSVQIDKKTLKTCDEVMKRYGGIDKLVKLVESDGLGFEEMSAVRAALAASKIPAMLKMVEDYEEQEEPVVVFSAYRAPIDTLATRPGWAVITGDTPPDERSRIEDAFQAGRLKGVASTIKAGGVAITLTRAAHALFVDLEWTPALNAQAEDRICRIGQTRGCIITTLTAEHPLDERIVELLTQKSQMIDASVDAAREVQVPTEPQVQGVDFESLIKAAEEEVRLADESLARKAKEPMKHPRRGPKSSQEDWAAQALIILAGLDPDGASEKNDVGFNGTDSGFGRSLAQQVSQGLSDKQWELAIEICKKYHRQVGRCP